MLVHNQNPFHLIFLQQHPACKRPSLRLRNLHGNPIPSRIVHHVPRPHPARARDDGKGATYSELLFHDVSVPAHEAEADGNRPSLPPPLLLSLFLPKFRRGLFIIVGSDQSRRHHSHNVGNESAAAVKVICGEVDLRKVGSSSSIIVAVCISIGVIRRQRLGSGAMDDVLLRESIPQYPTRGKVSIGHVTTRGMETGLLQG
mmetsp:Transcript_11618/g.20933  ORF Transcript_11618/g.20933 Transcript_11618/m.20933 type:complete len:201 (-) Transcript_11618:840-1442(-)